jgi:C1q domain
MSILSAGTSNTTSLIYTGDTTGAMVFQTNGTTEAMRITAGQSVGIGITSPSYKVDVSGALRVTNSSGSTIIANRSSNPGSIEIQHSGTQTAQLSAVSGGGLEFYQGSTPTLAMKYDSAGRVTKPYQPFFYARKTNSQTVPAGTTVSFDAITTNIGSHYSTSTNRFTAPIAGVYSFTAKVWMSKNGGSYADFSPRVNGTLIPNSAGAYYDGSINSTGYANYIVNFQYSLNAGDYVEFTVGGNANLILDNSGYFCGFLVS